MNYPRPPYLAIGQQGPPYLAIGQNPYVSLAIGQPLGQPLAQAPVLSPVADPGSPNDTPFGPPSPPMVLESDAKKQQLKMFGAGVLAGVGLLTVGIFAASMLTRRGRGRR